MYRGSCRYTNSYNKRLPVAVALKFTMHVVQSFIKGHRKSDVNNRISYHIQWNNVRFLRIPVTVILQAGTLYSDYNTYRASSYWYFTF